MATTECTTLAMDWTSSALVDMTTFNSSYGIPSPVGRKYKTDTALMVLLITTSIIGFFLNIAALAVLLQKKNIQTTTNHYLVMLAVGDILMCTIVIPLRVTREHNVVSWTAASCRVYGVIRHTPMFVSMNTIVLIAIERCVAVVFPAKFAAFASPRNVKIQLGLVWLLALVELIFPVFTIKPVKFGGMNFCSMAHKKSHLMYVFVCLVALPLTLLIITYGTIIVTLVRHQKNSRGNVEMTPASRSGNKEQAGPCRRRRNTRVIIMSAIITAFFVVCWMPIFALTYLNRFYGVRLSRHLLSFVHVMFYLHPIFNPFVYFFVDARFRAKFVSLFWRKNVNEDNISMASVTEVAVVHQ